MRRSGVRPPSAPPITHASSITYKHNVDRPDFLNWPISDQKKQHLNWDGPGPNGTGESVYSTIVNTYNARDQITQVREYAGVEGSGTYQDTTMTYDGHGRLKNRRVPEQNDGTATVWSYNADDTVSNITDARGAVTTFSYSGNGRHLVSSVTHTLSGSPTITASYTYDAVGNRKKMTDGFGDHTLPIQPTFPPNARVEAVPRRHLLH